jgi:hypothetical protein
MDWRTNDPNFQLSFLANWAGENRWAFALIREGRAETITRIS